MYHSGFENTLVYPMKLSTHKALFVFPGHFQHKINFDIYKKRISQLCQKLIGKIK